MRRRRILAAGGALLFAGIGAGAQRARTHRIAFLGATTANGHGAQLDALRAGLQAYGYVEDKNMVLDFRWAAGDYERLPQLAAELVQSQPDVLITHSQPGVRAAKQATTTIPIVMAVVGDPVATGIVASLVRPGGNITGSTFFLPELSAKRLEILGAPRFLSIGFSRARTPGRFQSNARLASSWSST